MANSPVIPTAELTAGGLGCTQLQRRQSHSYGPSQSIAPYRDPSQANPSFSCTSFFSEALTLGLRNSHIFTWGTRSTTTQQTCRTLCTWPSAFLFLPNSHKWPPPHRHWWQFCAQSSDLTLTFSIVRFLTPWPISAHKPPSATSH